MPKRLGLSAVASATSSVVLLAPLVMIFYGIRERPHPGLAHALRSEHVHAFKVTLIAAAIAVPLNTVFGVLCALVIVRRRFPGKGLLNAFIDLPLAISPVVIGVCLFLLYAPRGGWFGTGCRSTASRCCSPCRRSCSRRSSSRCRSSRAR